MELRKEDAWMEEVDRRLQKDEWYCTWQKEKEDMMDILLERLPEREGDLLMELMSTWTSIAVYKELFAYEIGVETGLVMAKESK